MHVNQKRMKHDAPPSLNRDEHSIDDRALADMDPVKKELLQWQNTAFKIAREAELRAQHDQNVIKHLLELIQQSAEKEEFYTERIKALTFLANHDRMTGSLNRFGGEEQLVETFMSVLNTNRRLIANRRYHLQTSELQNNRQLGQPLTKACFALIAIDIDHFKSLNDTYGHAIGDEVLKKVANTIQQLCRREKDVMLIRDGGEEFLVAVPCQNTHESLEIAEKIRHAVETNCSVDNGKRKITVSIGVLIETPELQHRNMIKKAIRVFLQQLNKTSDEQLQGPSHMYAEITPRNVISDMIRTIYIKEWHKKADQCLYVAKKRGRNCVYLKEGALSAEIKASPFNPPKYPMWKNIFSPVVRHLIKCAHL